MRTKLVQELQLENEAQHKSSAAHGMGIVRTGRASCWRSKSRNEYALKLIVVFGGGEVGVY